MGTIAAGIENVVVVRPESVIAEMSVDIVTQEIEGTGVTTHDVDDPDEARERLASR